MSNSRWLLGLQKPTDEIVLRSITSAQSEDKLNAEFSQYRIFEFPQEKIPRIQAIEQFINRKKVSKQTVKGTSQYNSYINSLEMIVNLPRPAEMPSTSRKRKNAKQGPDDEEIKPETSQTDLPENQLQTQGATSSSTASIAPGERIKEETPKRSADVIMYCLRKNNTEFTLTKLKPGEEKEIKQDDNNKVITIASAYQDDFNQFMQTRCEQLKSGINDKKVTLDPQKKIQQLKIDFKTPILASSTFIPIPSKCLREWQSTLPDEKQAVTGYAVNDKNESMAREELARVIARYPIGFLKKPYNIGFIGIEIEGERHLLIALSSQLEQQIKDGVVTNEKDPDLDKLIKLCNTELNNKFMGIHKQADKISFVNGLNLSGAAEVFGAMSERLNLEYGEGLYACSEPKLAAELAKLKEKCEREGKSFKFTGESHYRADPVSGTVELQPSCPECLGRKEDYKKKRVEDPGTPPRTATVENTVMMKRIT